MRLDPTPWKCRQSAVVHWWYMTCDCASVAWTETGHGAILIFSLQWQEKGERGTWDKKARFSKALKRAWIKLLARLFPRKGFPLSWTQSRPHGREDGGRNNLTKRDKTEGRKDQEVTTETLPEEARVGSQKMVSRAWILLKVQLEPAQELSSTVEWEMILSSL